LKNKSSLKYWSSNTLQTEYICRASSQINRLENVRIGRGGKNFIHCHAELLIKGDEKIGSNMYRNCNEDLPESVGLCHKSEYVITWERKYNERNRRNIKRHNQKKFSNYGRWILRSSIDKLRNLWKVAQHQKINFIIF
jgi:hypothetical protein